MNKKNSFIKNVIADMPDWMKYTIFAVLFVFATYFSGKYAPFVASIKQKMLEMVDTPSSGQIFAVNLLAGIMILFMLLILAFIIYFLYCAIIFFVIEYKISKLPENHFTRYREISPEELCLLLDAFCFRGHCLSKIPSFLYNNINHIQQLTKNYTVEQIRLVKRHPAAEAYFVFRYQYSEENGWIFNV